MATVFFGLVHREDGWVKKCFFHLLVEKLEKICCTYFGHKAFRRCWILHFHFMDYFPCYLRCKKVFISKYTLCNEPKEMVPTFQHPCVFSLFTCFVCLCLPVCSCCLLVLFVCLFVCLPVCSHCLLVLFVCVFMCLPAVGGYAPESFQINLMLHQ